MITIDDLYRQGFTKLQIEYYFPKPSKQKITNYTTVEERGRIKSKKVITYVNGWNRDQIKKSIEYLKQSVIDIPEIML